MKTTTRTFNWGYLREIVKYSLQLILCIIVSTSISHRALAQSEANRNNNWLWAGGAGIKFPGGTPLTGPSIPTPGEGVATISDLNGNILFTTDGATIWDNTNTAKVTGLPATLSTSATQRVVAFPVPCSASKYYVAILGADAEGHKDATNPGVSYVVYDAATKTATAPTQIVGFNAASSTEKLTVIPSSDGVNYWLVNPDQGSSISAFKSNTSGTLGAAVTSAVSFTNWGGGLSVGESKSSQPGAAFNPGANQTWYTMVDYAGHVNIFTFNQTTGVFSNPKTFTISGGSAYYGAGISPDGHYLFVSNLNDGSVKRYDLTSATPQSTEVTFTVTGLTAGGAIQLGPDGKLYTSGLGQNKVVAIDNPNAASTGSYTFTTIATPSGGYGVHNQPLMAHACPANLISTQPTNQTASGCPGNATFSVTAANACTFQWEVSTDGGATWSNVPGGAPYSGGTSNSLTLTNVGAPYNNYQYRVKVSTSPSGTCQNTSNAVTLTVSCCPTVTNTLSSAAGTDGQTKCINTAITNITYAITNSTGASVTGLPAGVTGSYSGGTFTISGTPTASGTFNYTVTPSGGCTSPTTTGTITVNPNNTVTAASSSPTPCINTAMTNITHTTTGATGIGAATGLPAGVSAAWAGNTITISGTPTASGTFNYTIPLTGGCGAVNATGTITVKANNTVTAASSSPTPCINTAMTNITHTTTGATGIGAATGLPAGVTAAWAGNTITISGTPTATGTFNYTIPLSGGCGAVNATGTITVKPNNTVTAASSSPSPCINTAMTNITHTTTGATGIGAATGLPAGVTAAWAGNTITISGTPTAAGTFNYTIPLTGGCGAVNATGTITVVTSNTVTAASSSPTPCINTAMTSITHTTTGATGIGAATGLPAGVTAAWAGNTITISGTPTAAGTFNYTIPLTGGCGAVSATGTITVVTSNTVTAASSSPTPCINSVMTNITHTTTGATGIGAATGLPAGVTAAWAGNTITISGTPTASGTFNYTIPLTGGCGSVNATGTITVKPNNTVTAASSSPTPCINSVMTNITHTTTGATGIGAATGLPAGVTAAWAGNTITISGTPTVSGTFNYTIPLSGGCGAVSATGTITVVTANSVGAASSSPTPCINTVMTNITHGTTGATGIGAATGLPAGVTATWAGSTITISGTPTASGTFNYTIPLTGGCGAVSATGTITVSPDNTVGAASSSPTPCINTAMTNITHTTTGATGIGAATGLPAGVTAAWAGNTITISGTPTASGTFNYTIPLTGGCGSVNATGTITVKPANTVTAASSSPTPCINTAMTNITHTTTGATGIGAATGLPAGVSAAWAGNTITVSGTPTVSGTFNYTIPLTGGCGSVNATGTITIVTANSVTAASSSPTPCINTAMTSITHTTTGATGIGAATGLPAGVTAAWAGNTITISGTPTASGTFNYTIPLTGGCGSVNATGTITVSPDNTVGAASSSPTPCINSVMTNITHATTGATGIGAATGLPAGVTASWAGNTITISGTPTVSGTFNYTIPLTGGCGSVSATGTITVVTSNTVGAASSSPTPCINTAMTSITHTTTGATGIGAATGLPAGVTAAWAGNTITISGTPSASGTFNYTIPLTGGCGAVNATGTITVSPDNTVTAASLSPTPCINTAMTNITHTTTGATGIGAATGLPAGVTAAWAGNTITISGTPTASGTFNYTIPLTGGCGSVNATGIITVSPDNTVGAASSSPTPCINSVMTNITHATTGATGIGAATGLPAGVTAAWAGNTITISGTPTVSGTFNYTIPLTGGCGSVSATGTITVVTSNTVTAASSSPTPCINTAMTNITHTTTGATGIGAATGLPGGITATWAGNTITISGTPTASGTFNYTIPLTGGCGSVNATGTITVSPDNTVGAASSSPTPCINSVMTNITHATTGATGIGAAAGLPAGVTATWAGSTITISGTPTASGTFNYTIPLTGGCGSVNATGTITVSPAATVSLSSAAGTNAQTVCVNTAISNITYSTGNATGATITGLPTGVTGSYSAGVFTISGTPTTATGSPFSYTVTATGGCGSPTAPGTITVRPAYIPEGITITQDTICAGNTVTFAITNQNAVGYNWMVGSGVTDLSPATNSPKTFQFDNAGDITIKVKPIHPCTSITIDTVIHVIVPPVANAGSDIHMENLAPINLNGTGSSTGTIYKYNWTSSDPGAMIQGATSINATSLPTELNSTYTLTVSTTNDAGCSVSDDVDVTITPIVKIPNVFSPNKDNIHDVLIIQNIQFFPKAVLYVYNQWGELIYKSQAGYPEPWDGTRDGKECAVSAYYYVLELNQSDYKSLAGSVTIIK